MKGHIYSKLMTNTVMKGRRTDRVTVDCYKTSYTCQVSTFFEDPSFDDEVQMSSVYSVHEEIVPSAAGILHSRGFSTPGSFHLRELSPPGAFTPESFHPQEFSPPRIFNPGSFRTRPNSLLTTETRRHAPVAQISNEWRLSAQNSKPMHHIPTQRILEATHVKESCLF